MVQTIDLARAHNFLLTAPRTDTNSGSDLIAFGEASVLMAREFRLRKKLPTFPAFECDALVHHFIMPLAISGICVCFTTIWARRHPATVLIPAIKQMLLVLCYLYTLVALQAFPKSLMDQLGV